MNLALCHGLPKPIDTVNQPEHASERDRVGILFLVGLSFRFRVLRLVIHYSIAHPFVFPTARGRREIISKKGTA